MPRLISFKMSLRYWLVLGGILYLGESRAAGVEFSPTLQKAYSEVFKLRTESGKRLIESEDARNPYRIYLENYLDFIQVFISDSKSDYEKLLEKEDDRLEQIEESIPDSPYNRFLRAEVKMQLALVRIKFGNEVKAAWSVIQASRLLEENQKLYPNFLPHQKSLGCLHIVLGSVPENYKWVLKILGLKGNLHQGIAELNRASKDKIWGNEALYSTLFFQESLLTFNEKENSELLKVIESQPDNSSFYFLGISISLKTGRTEQAARLLAQLPKGTSYPAISIAEMYQGDVSLNRGNYADASRHYAQYLKNFSGKSYLKEIHYKLFLCHWLSGDERKAKTLLAKIPTVGSAFAESDKAAEKFFENYTKTGELPNKELLEVRLALDGGYHERTLALFKNISEKQLTGTKDKAEYCFRAGKIYRIMHQNEKAIGSFERAILLNEHENWHFGASSSLQLGYLYQMKGQRAQAKSFFEKAISYKKHEYKNSIDSKARAALTEMGVATLQ